MNDGRLFESTGLEGHSDVREVDPATGRVVRATPLADDEFGEGLAAVDDELVQLTWQNGVAFALGPRHVGRGGPGHVQAARAGASASTTPPADWSRPTAPPP